VYMQKHDYESENEIRTVQLVQHAVGHPGYYRGTQEVCSGFAQCKVPPWVCPQRFACFWDPRLPGTLADLPQSVGTIFSSGPVKLRTASASRGCDRAENVQARAPDPAQNQSPDDSSYCQKDRAVLPLPCVRRW
jgi:hypothetical protein